MSTVHSIDFISFAESTPAALDAIDARSVLKKEKSILIKPNLINMSPPPVTTPVEICDAIVAYIRSCSDASIVIAEGCGEPDCETPDVFRAHGYNELAQKYNLELIDLNTAKTRHLKNSECSVFKDFHLPEIALDSYLISVPVLKAHSIAEITGSLKNMMGLAPPKHYQRGGFWKKAAFHARMQQSITDLNSYRTPDMTIMDASIGLAEFHLGGAQCNPPAAKILAGYDTKEVDRKAAEILGMAWQSIGHLR